MLSFTSSFVSRSISLRPSLALHAQSRCTSAARPQAFVSSRPLHTALTKKASLLLQTSTTSLSSRMKVDSSSRGKRTVFIQTENTPNPDSLKFYPTGKQILPEGSGTKDYPTLTSASSSPLAKRLFRIEGVKGVFLSSSFLSVNKDPEVAWHILKPMVFSAMMDHFTSDEPSVVEGVASTAPAELPTKPEDVEVVAMIKEIIETRIRPAVQEDGGDVEFRGYESGVVFLKMQGSCSTCPSSSVTLKNGIERMLMHWVPDVTNVMAMEDDELKRLAQEQFDATEKRLKEQAEKGPNAASKAAATA